MPKKIFLIAAEPSGDMLGADLMRSLNKHGNLKIIGVGGAAMEKEGLKSLFPISDIAVMGITEVLPKLFIIQKRMAQVIDAILEEKPDLVMTIDAPSFNFRVCKKVRSLYKGPIFHYVAPSVWAWKKWRADWMAKYFDHLFCLFPFEPPYFKKLPCTFVGHPVFNDNVILSESEGSKDAGQMAREKVTISVLPGSRVVEVKRHLPIFMNAISKLKFKKIHLLFPTLPHLKDLVEKLLEGCPFSYEILVNDRYNAFARSHAALAASGTVSLELARFKVPAIIAYKVSAITAFIARRMIKVKYASIINIMANREIMPEFLQEKCTSVNLARALQALLSDPAKYHAMQEEYDAFAKKMQGGADLAGEVLKAVGA